MTRKRVVLANSSRLLREMFQRVIDKADNLEVVQELPSQEGLPAVIERLGPEWVILSSPRGEWLDVCMAEHPSVRFILLSPDNKSITMRWQVTCEEDLTNLSLGDFIHILEKDLQHI